MRILVTGAGGMLGRDLTEAAISAGHKVTALERARLDITDSEAVRRAVEAALPEVVINCAAYTDVDGAEAAPELASAVNGAGAGNVACAAAAVEAWTIHVSSDYVFDGCKGAPYVESDEPRPLSRYGQSKLAGEHAVAQAAASAHTIVRSSWLFGAHGRCFPATILRLARERDELSVVDDQVGCPTFTGHLATGLIELAANRCPGVVHMAGGGHCSWHEFASEIVRRVGLSTRVLPAATLDLNRPAPRPPYSVIVSERGAPSLPAWREGLDSYLVATEAVSV